MKSRPFLAASLVATLRGIASASALMGAWICEASLPVDPEMPIHVSVWQSSDGLPSNKITAVLQTRDGYIWVGSYEGLARFDGAEFELVEGKSDGAATDVSVTALEESPDGALWVGRGAGMVSRYWDGGFENFPPLEERQGTRIVDLEADAAGDVWSINESGVVIRVRDGWELHPEAGDSQGVFGLAISREGELWVTRLGLLSRLSGDRLEPVPLAPQMGRHVHGLASSSSGGIWVVAGDELWKFGEDRWQGPFGRLVTEYAPVFAALESRSGQYLAGTSDQGAVLATVKPFAQRVLQRSTNLPSDWIMAVCEDSEGGLWLGTGTAGLIRLSRESVHLMAPADAWGGRGVMAVAQTRDGALWASTEGAGVYRYQRGEWERFGLEEGLENLYIWSLCEAPDGRLLAGSWGGGVFEITGERFSRARGLESLDIAVAAMLPSAFGGVLLGTPEGVRRYVGDEVVWLQEDPAQRFRDVRFLLEDADGAVWVACNEGLGLIGPSGTRRYTRRDGLSTNFLRCLYRADDGALWIGTRGGGLNRFKDGAFVSVAEDQGLIDDTICHIEDDGLGNLWIGTIGGVMRISLEELNACADGRARRVEPLSFERSGGAQTLTCSGPSQPVGARLADGDLVFATSNGIARIDPNDLAINTAPPRVEIQSIKLGERLVYEGGPVPPIIVAGPNERRLEIEYAALTFEAPEKVRFRRRLVGQEEAWEDIDGSRRVAYSFLPPGKYSFQVTAANADNVWNRSGASVAFVFEPQIWETTWFMLSVLAVLLATASLVVWQLSRVRHRAAIERVERSRALEQERARIANDMHDDLGSHLTRITMLSETAKSQISDAQKVQQCLGVIYDTARSVTLAMDEIVWAVNPRHDSLQSLIAYLEKFAHDHITSAGMKCRLEMPLSLSDWRPNSEVRHNLFLAFKEALNNAIRHSGGDQVAVSMELGGGWCRVSVTDNGKGMAPEPCPAPDRIATGHGLANMRERMDRIGGRFYLRSAAERGLEALFEVPMR